jgi:ATP-binding cassette subfamily F protein uup
VVLVVSHDRYFLNRVCTDILAFEGDGKIAHSVGDYDYYLEKKQRAAQAAAKQNAAILATNKSAALAKEAAAAKANKQRKLSFKETRELEGIEEHIRTVEADVARIEGLFADPEFFRKHAAQVNQLTGELELAKKNVATLYARWEALEAIKTAAEQA